MNGCARSGMQGAVALAVLLCHAASAGSPADPADASKRHGEATTPLVTTSAMHDAAVAAARESTPPAERLDVPTGAPTTPWAANERIPVATGVAAVALRFACGFSRNCSVAEVASASPASALRPPAAIARPAD